MTQIAGGREEGYLPHYDAYQQKLICSSPLTVHYMPDFVGKWY